MEKDSLLNILSGYRDDMARFTGELVGIPTENPPGRCYRDCVEAIAAELSRLGLTYRIHEVGAEKSQGSLPRFWLDSYTGEGARVLYFHGHYDVVPASSKQQFNPRIADGKLYGRGSSDMKGGLSAMVYAVKALEESGVRLDGRIGLVFVPDEETGGEWGSAQLANVGLLGRDGVGMVTAEPTSRMIWNASRGAISLRIKVKGRPAHVGLHYEGVNAFERMVEVAGKMMKLKADLASAKTSFRIEPDEARSSILMLGGRVEGGDNFNVVPEECTFTLDRRINPEENLEREKRKLFELFGDLREEGIGMDVVTLQEGSSTGVPEDSALGQALSASIEEVTGKPARFEMCPGLLETRFYADRGVPALAYGPGLLTVSHGPNEFIEIDDIVSSAVVYALTAVRLLSAAS